MTAAYAAQVRAAQKKTTVRYQGKTYRRIPYGEIVPWTEGRDFSKPCPDCGVTIGQYHLPICDQDTCPVCLSWQAISCKHHSDA